MVSGKVAHGVPCGSERKAAAAGSGRGCARAAADIPHGRERKVTAAGGGLRLRPKAKGGMVEILELALVVLACVIGSAILCQVVPRLSLPLVQIAVGCAVALLVPAIHDVHVSSELFLVLFIAPLLFNEARNTEPRELWENKGAILSLAVGLVLLTVLAVGFALNWFVPSIPLAAAFACAAALAPTDAAAVGALASSVSLKKRQSTLLSGESQD